MNYQMILQFEANSTQDFDRLVAFEDRLNEELNDEVDGHDFGSGEFNIFLDTDDVKKTFKKVQTLAKDQQILDSLKAAYRDGDSFVILWPPGLKEFKIA
jgi:hypothetical protein